MQMAQTGTFQQLDPSLECVRNEEIVHMRTNIVIDDALMDEALKATGLKTKREAVELGLRTLVQLSRQREVKKLRGKVQWIGDLDAMRLDGRHPDSSQKGA